MDDLIAFLRDRIAEDEAVALAGERYWHGVSIESATEAEEDHIRRWDPARVLAEVEAKRKLIELHSPFVMTYGRGHTQCDHCAGLCHSRSGLGCDTPVDALWPCPTIRLITQPYAEHAEYRPEWRA